MPDANERHHIFICSVCHTLVKLVHPDHFPREIRTHRMQHDIYPVDLGTVCIVLDMKDDSEPYLSDFMAWRAGIYDTNAQDS